MRLDFSEPRNSTLINNLLQGEIDFIFFLTRSIRSDQLVTRNLRSKVIAEADKITEFQVGFESEPRFNFIESSRNFVSSFDNLPSISESKIIGRVSWRQALYRIPLSGCCMTTTSLNQLRILFSISFKVSSIKHCLPLPFAVNSRETTNFSDNETIHPTNAINYARYISRHCIGKCFYTWNCN